MINNVQDDSLQNKILIEVKDLKKHFEISKGFFKKQKSTVKAVDKINFKIYNGETLGIVGESGCGKSTAGQLILGLLEPTEGEVIFDEKLLSTFSQKELRKARKDLQVIFQDPYSSLNPRMTVEELIGEPLIVHNIMKGEELRKKVLELMELVGLQSHQLKRYPHEFSGGQRQRIGIARALSLDPKIIVCDEAVSALDVSIQAQILNLLKSLQKKLDLTFIFIAHGIPAVKHISDRIAVMYLGRIVELASKEDLFNNPLHPYSYALLDSVPIPDPELRRDNRETVSGEIPSPTNPPQGCHFHPRCKFAQERCKVETPEYREIKKDHFIACHFPLIESSTKVLQEETYY